MSVDKKLRNSLYERLYKMRSELPLELKMKISDDHLRSLTMSVMDGTVVQIVRELEEIQQLSESSFLKKRMKVVSQQSAKMSELLRNQANELNHVSSNEAANMKERHEKESSDLRSQLNKQLRITDQEIILELDQMVVEQQSTLHQAAIPCFKITNNPQDILLQTHILDFIQRLSKDVC